MVKGSKHSEAAKALLSRGVRGANNPQWGATRTEGERLVLARAANRRWADKAHREKWYRARWAGRTKNVRPV